MSRLRASKAGALVARVGYVRSAKSPPIIPRMPAMMCHVIREIPKGIEVRRRLCMKCNVVNKKPKEKDGPIC